ncbi:MAG TPA: hypothetical protein VGM69_06535 [Chloroflexota bacterium]|jgi:hypothetical protein
MRLQRGRVALQRLLTTELRGEAAAFGLVRDADEGTWTDTRIWCPVCARRRLQARFTGGAAEFWLRCPDCHRPQGAFGWHSQLHRLPRWLRDAGGHSAILAAVLDRSARQYGAALRGAPEPCWRCGHPVEVRRGRPLDAPPAFQGSPMVSLVCGACGATSSSHLGGLILSLPESRAFWREHRRILVRPEQEVVVAGRPAYRALLESVASAARLEVLADRATLRVLRADGREVSS